MIVGKCSPELSGHKHKKPQPLSEAPRRSVVFGGVRREVEEPVLSKVEGTPAMLVDR
jgi:hypothetical protein